MAKNEATAQPPTVLERLPHSWLVPLLLLLCAGLAISSLVGDSLTFDEFIDLTSGTSYLKNGDFRLAPGHPPLAKMWAALPAVLSGQPGIANNTPGWREGWRAGWLAFRCLSHRSTYHPS